MLNVWTQPSGYSFGTLQEQQSVTLPLPISSSEGVLFTLISGALPDGLFLEGAYLIGAPLAVPKEQTYSFCIRASQNSNISDRTFSLKVFGYNPPTFLTPAGTLPVGPNKQFYTPDQTYISYQLSVADINVAGGAILTFYIADGDGVLPPGLTLSSSGLISGYIKPSPQVVINDGAGNFDEQTYDTGVFDFGLRSTNGFDSYQYDDVIFDYAEIGRASCRERV